jgi:3-oxoacyl-[acyl-carrier protein] reductase
VLVTGRNEQKLMQARDDLAKRTGGEVHAMAADMTKEADIAKNGGDRKGQARRRRHPGEQRGPDVFRPLRRVQRRRDADAARHQAVRLPARNPRGLPDDEGQRWGRIVNTIGGAGKEPDPYMFGSGMTNSALLNLTKSLSTEFGKDNVLVNAICPGWVATDLWVRNTEGMKKEFGVQTEADDRKIAAKKNSLQRMGKPEELANATVFLCSERASYITGVSLNMDGGRLKGLW